MEKNEKNPTIKIKQATELSGLSEHMLTYLARIDVLKPSCGGGRGRPRLYTFSDVLFLRVISELLSRGIEVKKLKKALYRAQKDTESWIDIRKAPRRYLVTDGTEVFIRKRGELVSKTLDGQLAFAFVLDLAMAHQAVSQAWPKDTEKKIVSGALLRA